MTAVRLTPEQRVAADHIDAFLTAKRVERQWISLQGLAGTGKSHTLADIARRYPQALICAPTGKAASVLARKSGLEVSTVHSAIYQFRGQYVDEESGEQRLSFKPRIRDGSWSGMIALLDESSMVGGALAGDLLATGCRVVATGDPGQLPPVRDTGFFGTADVLLTEVHRQALDSPIIRQAHSVRQTGLYRADGEGFQVRRNIGRDDILGASVILCWRNATRHALNALVRAHKGLDGPPVTGEVVVCLRNNREAGVLNGARYTLLRDYDALRRVVRLRNESGCEVSIENCRFETIDGPAGMLDQEAHPFGFGYAMTVHKMQGSGEESIILVDEYDRHEWRREWLYTGMTRAEKRVLVHSTWA